MTSINAGGAFYRVQNELSHNADRLSQNMQRLASGKQNISPGDRTASSAVAYAMKAESASLKIGLTNGTEALQSLEMVTNDLAQMNDIVIRLEEIHALGSNGFNTAEDETALSAEATSLLTEMSRISSAAKWKGNAIIKQSATDTTTNTMNFGRNNSSIDIVLEQFKIPEVALGFNTAGDSIYLDIDTSTGASATGTAYASSTATPIAVAARTVADTKVGDRVVQSALAVNGAVFYEHLTKAGQDKFNTTGTADANGISLSASADTAAAAGLLVAQNFTVGQVVTGITAGKTNTHARQVLMTATGDNSAAKFTIVGTDANGKAISETLTGVSGTTASSVNLYKTIASITHSGTATTGTVTTAFGTSATNQLQLNLGGALAANGTVTNAAGRNVTITSQTDDSAATFTVTGTDINGNAQVETMSGSDATGTKTATTVAFFKTITSVVGDRASAGTIEVGVGATIGGGPVELAGTDVGKGSAEAALALLALKTVVDKMNISAGTLYNKVSNTMSHMGSLNAGYQLDVASKMDVDFAGETALLAKGQILAQAGTAMLAQANAQQQSVLALLQS